MNKKITFPIIIILSLLVMVSADDVLINKYTMYPSNATINNYLYLLTNGSFITINITSITWNSGNATINWSNGQSFTSPNLTGPQGTTGPSGTNGTNGVNGTNGYSVNVTMVQNSGNLTLIFWWNGTGINFYNFTTSNLTGPQGATGPSGTNGTNGINGTNGVNGTNGYSINVTVVQNSGNLTLLFWWNGTGTNFYNFTTANLTGPQGETGLTGLSGTNGTEIINTTQNGNITLIGNMTATNFYGNLNASYILNSPWLTSIAYQSSAAGWTNTTTTITTDKNVTISGTMNVTNIIYMPGGGYQTYNATCSKLEYDNTGTLREARCI